MDLTFYTLSAYRPEIRPAPLERDWMDATPEKFAYRCLPLNIANQHGWEVLCPVDFKATWMGGKSIQAIQIECDGPPHLQPVSHFGSGVLTFHLHGVIRTEPGLNLMVMGSPNSLKDGIQPLTGVIETDWSPYSFTMNWRFTRSRHSVAFKKGEPIAFFFPVPRGLVDQTQPAFRPISDEPALAQRHTAWTDARNQFNKDLKLTDSQAKKDKWQKAYFRGDQGDGTQGTTDHQTKLKVRRFSNS